MLLRDVWTVAAEGRLSPREQCKLWALRQVLRLLDKDDAQYEWMSSQVLVEGGTHPSREAVRTFFRRVDSAGQSWYPGYTAGKRGRPASMTPKKRKAISRSMMAAKKRGVVPCYETALDLAPRATLNDATGLPFSRQRINEVLTTECYDRDPARPWEFRFGAKRRALLDEDKVARLDWAQRLLSEGRTAAWYRDNVVWVDICAKVIPGSPSKALDQEMAAKNKKKRLISPGSAALSVNMGGSATADKQCSFGDTRVFFVVALTRGVFGVKVFSKKGTFPGETPEGAGLLVSHLPELLKKMLGPAARLPRTSFSDRGPGFFHRKWGTITCDYECACREYGFKPWAGTNSKKGPHAQPRDIGDVLLHETAISWLRREEEKTRPRTPWQETPLELEHRMTAAARHINKEFDVQGLAMQFPERLRALVANSGDRLQT